ncbi:MAG: DivIVA domain-containing protein [candidate division Zixibacteria bacterium]|nr:DivIVA domain-containing protein [candidate division Zixibacteria bacterium]
MDLSPNDIRTYEFPTQMRGYGKDDVDSFLEEVAVSLEAVKQENLKLSMEIDSLKTQLTGLRQFEDTIKSAAIDARRNADMTIANAKKEADLMLSEARSEAEKIVESRVKKIHDIEAKLASAEMTKKSYFSKLQSLIKSHLEMIDNIAGGEIKSSDSDNIEVTESSEVDRHKMETLAAETSSVEPAGIDETDVAEDIVPATAEAESTEETEDDKETSSPEMQTDQNEVDTDTPDEESKQIDPELANALDSYKRKASAQTENDIPAPSDTHPVSTPSGLVETTQRAEDVPTGFIAKPPENSSEESTGRIQVTTAEREAIDSSEGNDTSPIKQPEPVKPENLAEELDKVVAKFEEEMDKATKT